MLRFIIDATYLGLFFLIGFVYCIILFPLGLISKKARDYLSYYNVKIAFKIIVFIAGTNVIVKGRENIPKDEAVLYVGNHRSFFDIIISGSILPPCVGYISKNEIKKFLPLSLWMYLINCEFLDRNSVESAIKVINSSSEKIKNGISMFIFPEGTRAKTDDAMLEFKEGSFKIAKKAKCKIVPVSFNNTSAIFEDQKPRLRKTTVCVEFGKPIDMEELSKEDKKAIGHYTYNVVKDMVQKNKELIK
jgi:1-acyl-sn-glycerol-3-phosphate acyltransferase